MFPTHKFLFKKESFNWSEMVFHILLQVFVFFSFLRALCLMLIFAFAVSVPGPELIEMKAQSCLASES